jgi:hypothetical protein
MELKSRRCTRTTGLEGLLGLQGEQPICPAEGNSGCSTAADHLAAHMLDLFVVGQQWLVAWCCQWNSLVGWVNCVQLFSNGSFSVWEMCSSGHVAGPHL